MGKVVKNYINNKIINMVIEIYVVKSFLKFNLLTIFITFYICS